MKIAFDFDGVCTDIAFVREQKVNEFDYLYSPFSISISKKREGILEIVSVFSLFADLFIITSRPAEDKIYIQDWLRRNQLLPFFQDVLCCGDVSKADTMTQQEISLLIDDKMKHLGSLGGRLNGVLWNKQSWLELVQEVFHILIADSTVSLKVNAKLILRSADCVTDLGASPVFILSFSSGLKLKLRICLNEEIRNRILYFLRATENGNYIHVSRLVASNGLAIIKTYVEGSLISTFDKEKRLIYIFKAGLALAKLHELKVTNPISELRFQLSEEIQSLLVCSADNYNMVITPEGEIAFIDLEACNSGSRWIDVCWTEHLLCENEQEKEALRKGYFEIYKGKKATTEEQRMAELNYKLWLTYQMQNSKPIHLKDSEKTKIIDETFHQLWSN